MQEGLVIVNLSHKSLKISRVLVVVLTIITFVGGTITGIFASKYFKRKKCGEDSVSYIVKSLEEYEAEQARIAEEIRKEQNRFQPLNEEEMTRMKRIYAHSDVKRVFLTFDDGPSENITPQVLDILDRENIKATFFIMGRRADNAPELLKREYNTGHFIANHSFSHSYRDVYSSVDATIEEFNHTNQTIKRILENDRFNTLVFRFPGGSVGGPYHDIKQEIKTLMQNNGVACLDWNALTNDAAGAETREDIIQNMIDTTGEQTSVVMLMHDAPDKQLTADCLPEVIKWYRDNGYEFQTLYDVIGRE